VSQAYQQSLVAASLYVDYIFLDTDERRKMAQNPHEYLIEQVQFTGDESVGSSSNKIKLNFNHPCKELVWVVQPDANVDYCSSLDSGGLLYRTLGAQPFNYTDAIDALPNAIHAFGGPKEVAGATGFINASGLFQMAGGADAANVPSTGIWASNSLPDVAFANQSGAGNEGSLVSDAGTFVLAETALDMHCWGENPVVTAKLQLNGQDRFSEREGSYFDVVQPFQHHTRNPDTGINVYSFSLRPEEHQPSGSCNFSRIDNAVLQLVLSSGTVAGTATAKVRVYAVNYNVLRVMSGINRNKQLCQKTMRHKQTGSVRGNFACAPGNIKPIVSGVTRM
jgi:Large eukaryotic DNA virus major capsid protein